LNFGTFKIERPLQKTFSPSVTEGQRSFVP
jgi:hypothetical protein